MSFTPKDWKDSPDTTTPITATALEDMETRLSAYADGLRAFEGVITSTGSDQRAEINSAIQNISVGAKLLLKPAAGNVPFVISGGSIVVDRAVGLEGVGAYPLYGGQSVDFKTIDVPMSSPYLAGTVIKQMTAATDAIQVTTAGLPVQLAGFGITFDSAIRFSNTGHGVNATPPAYLSAGLDNGALGSRWRDIVVFGHDGNHYGFVHTNILYGTFEHLHAFGGGLLLCEVNAGTAHGSARFYGGSVYSHIYGQLITAGSAHGIYLKATSSYPNGILFNRPQLTVQDIGATARTLLSSGSAPTSAQKIFKSDATVRNLTILQQDWEDNVGALVDIPAGVQSTWIDPAGIFLPYPANVQDILSERASSSTKRRLTNDLGVIVTSAEPVAFNDWVVYSKDVSPNRGWGPTTDGTGRWTMGGPVETKSYTTAGRPSTSGMPAGTQIFDSTLGKPIWWNGSNWKDAAGTTV